MGSLFFPFWGQINNVLFQMWPNRPHRDQVVYFESTHILPQVISTIIIHKLSLEIIIPHMYIVFILPQISFSSITLFNIYIYCRCIKTRKACVCVFSLTLMAFYPPISETSAKSVWAYPLLPKYQRSCFSPVLFTQ